MSLSQIETQILRVAAEALGKLVTGDTPSEVVTNMLTDMAEQDLIPFVVQGLDKIIAKVSKK